MKCILDGPWIKEGGCSEGQKGLVQTSTRKCSRVTREPKRELQGPKMDPSSSASESQAIAQDCSLSAQVRAATAEVQRRKWTLVRSRFVADHSSNLRRQFFKFASNAVSQHRRSSRGL